MATEPTFTLGIEEEYLLVDVNTLELANDPPASLLDECQKLSGKQITPEFLRSQVEVGTKVCSNITEAREDLIHLRRVIIDVAARHGLAPIAASRP